MASYYRFKIPETKIFTFALVCASLDIDTLLSWSDDELFEGKQIKGIIALGNSKIPEAMQLENINKEFGKYINHFKTVEEDKL